MSILTGKKKTIEQKKNKEKKKKNNRNVYNTLPSTRPHLSCNTRVLVTRPLIVHRGKKD